MTKATITFDRLLDSQCLTSTDPADIFTDWHGDKENWLFVAPHDDDIVCGAGLTFLTALALGVKTNVVITSDGQMGYCRKEHIRQIADIRHDEAQRSFAMMGLPLDNITFLNFPDCNFSSYLGRRFIDDDTNTNTSTNVEPFAIANAVGLQNSYTWVLRRIRPTRVFLPSITDIHPDHQAVTKEFTISIFHASGGIWPELGEKIETIPHLYEYATYSDFISPPTIRIRTPQELLEKKLEGIRAYKSQEQIELLVDIQRKIGAKEFIREKRFEVFQPSKCDELFEAKSLVIPR
ncbi:MAG: PIG-L family deacetylase [Planctomycetaceae bacterium]|jgi:LmbE family N-acetylglucosaminyl deacetylase|nr:PIG-L family deacetylase [Planctomycetaceae bacterium]